MSQTTAYCHSSAEAMQGLPTHPTSAPVCQPSPHLIKVTPLTRFHLDCLSVQSAHRLTATLFFSHMQDSPALPSSSFWTDFLLLTFPDLAQPTSPKSHLLSLTTSSAYARFCGVYFVPASDLPWTSQSLLQMALRSLPCVCVFVCCTAALSNTCFFHIQS